MLNNNYSETANKGSVPDSEKTPSDLYCPWFKPKKKSLHYFP